MLSLRRLIPILCVLALVPAAVVVPAAAAGDVISVNDVPTAGDDSYGTAEDTPLTVNAPGLLTNDSDPNNELSVGQATTPSHGQLYYEFDGSFTYTPFDNWFGADSFTYRAYDGDNYSVPATVTITVTPVNDPPTASDHDGPFIVPGVSCVDAGASVLNIHTVDVDGDALTPHLYEDADHLDVTLYLDGTWCAEHDGPWPGTDSFRWRVWDGQAWSNIATVHLSTNPDYEFVDTGGTTFEGDIGWMWAIGITKGCNPPANTEYCPEDYVTRGQMAAFLVRALDYTGGAGDDLFTDDDTSIFENDIDRLATAGVTKGCNPPANTEYCPEDYVTRGQMAAFLVRALDYTGGAGDDLFTDDDTSIFENDIDRLATAGVTKGCNPPANTEYCPEDYVTRGQMAAFLHRALGG